MTTQYKITFDPATPEAQQDKTADASQNREQITPESFLDSLQPRKPADAHAADAHTPRAFTTADLRELYENALMNQERIAAERDRHWRAYMTTKRERDQAREQVRNSIPLDIYATLKKQRDTAEKQEVKAREQIKTLLAACKGLMACVESEWGADFIPYNLDEEASKQANKAVTAARAAIASIENEEAK